MKQVSQRKMWALNAASTKRSRKNGSSGPPRTFATAIDNALSYIARCSERVGNSGEANARAPARQETVASADPNKVRRSSNLSSSNPRQTDETIELLFFM